MAEKTKNISNSGTKSQEITQTSLFPLTSSNGNKVEVNFTLKKTSNDGGLLLLREAEKQLGLIDSFAGCIENPRNQFM